MPADASELRRLAYRLRTASKEADKAVQRTTAKAALNIKKDLQDEARTAGAGGYLSRVWVAISYDLTVADGVVEAEIGPEYGAEKKSKRAQGNLGWIAYEGSAVSGPVFPDPSGALEREAASFEGYLAAAAADGIVEAL